MDITGWTELSAGAIKFVALSMGFVKIPENLRISSHARPSGLVNRNRWFAITGTLQAAFTMVEQDIAVISVSRADLIAPLLPLQKSRIELPDQMIELSGELRHIAHTHID